MKKSTVSKILKETEIGYDLIADKFSETRSKRFWADLEFIKDYAKAGDRILDFGCGNGRLLQLFENKNIEYFGADVSQKLVDLAQKKHTGPKIHFQKMDSDQLSLPFADNFFNTAYSIAVFHHIPGTKVRKELARELWRVIQPGGYVVLSVWNLWRSAFAEELIRNWTKKAIGQSELDWNDFYISFKDNYGRIFNRYHHAFKESELKKLFSDAGFAIERCETVNGRNIVLVGKKK